jgi:hypothetical protein
MSKQTAVEWLVEQLIPNAMRTFDATTCNAIEQAKQMEKEQIMDAANKLLYHNTGPGNTAAEQYYNETYGGNK